MPKSEKDIILAEINSMRLYLMEGLGKLSVIESYVRNGEPKKILDSIDLSGEKIFTVRQMLDDLFEMAKSKPEFDPKFIQSIDAAYKRSMSLSSGQKAALTSTHQKWCKGKYK